jgi:hypothetical protein
MSDTPTKAPRREAPRQKVPAFARYEGTSAYKKDRRRARAYAAFKEAAAKAEKA